MFINNWYAACIADELGDSPIRVRMLGCDFVLFRDSTGTANCLSDTCCHRGASLAAGTCRDDLIICPQHGWEFNSAGKCTRIPAGTSDPDAPPKRARVPAYPVEEKYGIVFAFLGDLNESQRPVIPDIVPEYADGDAWHHGIISRQKDINYMRMSENYNDPCHVHYVHEFAKWIPKGVTIETHEVTDTYVKAFHAAWDAQGKWSSEVGLMMEYSVIGLMSRNTNYQPNYPMQIVLASVTPIDEHNSQIFMHLMQPKATASAADHKALMDMTEHQVMDEDYAVLKTTRPVQAAPPSEELLVEADVTVAQVRKSTVEYGHKMGVIDHVTLAALRDTHIHVIPCPAHQSDPKGWVHKTVPLIEEQQPLKAAV